MDDDVQVSIRTPSEFRTQIMERDYEAFMQAPTDLRLAFHAATSLFHLCDWVACAQSIPRFHLQRELEARCEYFGLISDVADAGKHLKLTISSGSMAEAGEGQLNKFGVFGYGIGPGKYGHASACLWAGAGYYRSPRWRLVCECSQESPSDVGPIFYSTRFVVVR